MAAVDETIRFYDERASEYATHESGPVQQQQLAEFAAGLPRGARVLDLGSGGGHDTLSLTSFGSRVTPIDGSVGLAKETERRTGLKVRVLRFEDLDYVDEFDGVWAAASLHHAPSNLQSAVFVRVAAALQSCALLFASFKEADADWHDSLGRFFCAMTLDKLEQHAREAGLSVEKIERSKARGFDGSETTWLAMSARKD